MRCLLVPLAETMTSKRSETYANNNYTLWIYHKRPSSRVRHNNTIVHTKTVNRQSCNVPISDLNWFSQRSSQRELSRAGNLFFFTDRQPTLGGVLQGNQPLNDLLSIRPKAIFIRNNNTKSAKTYPIFCSF